MLTIQQANEQLQTAYQKNPGPWVEHSRSVAETPDGLPNIPTASTRTPPTRWDCCMTSDELPVSVESATSLTDMTG